MRPCVEALDDVGINGDLCNPVCIACVDGSLAIAPRSPGYLPVKFFGEWLTALVLLVLTAPLMLVLAAAVRLTSKGPAFYAQSRLGRHGKAYRLYKIRTMVHNAEAATGPVWAAKNDCRTTKLGKLLRKTHLDELPQLWNILRGDMGLIGPRPERPEIVARLEPKVPGYRLRLSVRPGITGLAQMLVPADDPNDVALTGLRQKVAHDVYYVREVRLMMDVRIAVGTVCYFLAEAMDSVRRSALGGYGERVQAALESRDEPEAETRFRIPLHGTRCELRMNGQGDVA